MNYQYIFDYFKKNNTEITSKNVKEELIKFINFIGEQKESEKWWQIK